jgi:hypothetical protein
VTAIVAQVDRQRALLHERPPSLGDDLHAPGERAALGVRCDHRHDHHHPDHEERAHECRHSRMVA